MKKLLLVFVSVLLLLAGCSKEGDSNVDEQLEGNWTGEIHIPGQPLMFQVSFADDLTGTVSIPVQGLENYPLSNATMKEENNLVFMLEIQGQHITFDGILDDGLISGTFSQSGQQFPFELWEGESPLQRGEANDFLEIETSKGTLYGEMEMPEGDGPFPVMVIIPGSGPTDRNGNSAGGENNSLKLVAEQLAEQGIASLRYDKRGAGKNQLAVVAEKDMDFDQFVEDAVQWVELLKEDESFSQVGIIGHSQGSLVGILASQETEVDALVSIAGAGRPIDQVLAEQLKAQLPEDLMEESNEILQQLKAGGTVEEVSAQLQSVFRPSVQPFLSSWMQYDPVEEIVKMDSPVLIINGKNDLQVPILDAELLHEAKPDADMLLMDSMNHVLKEAPSDPEGNRATYHNPELPLAQGLIERIVTFIEENM